LAGKVTQGSLKSLRLLAIFPDDIAARLKRMKAALAHLPMPDGAGRRIAMPSAK